MSFFRIELAKSDEVPFDFIDKQFISRKCIMLFLSTGKRYLDGFYLKNVVIYASAPDSSIPMPIPLVSEKSHSSYFSLGEKQFPLRPDLFRSQSSGEREQNSVLEVGEYRRITIASIQGECVKDCSYKFNIPLGDEIVCDDANFLTASLCTEGLEDIKFFANLYTETHRPFCMILASLISKDKNIVDYYLGYLHCLQSLHVGNSETYEGDDGFPQTLLWAHTAIYRYCCRLNLGSEIISHKNILNNLLQYCPTINGLFEISIIIMMVGLIFDSAPENYKKDLTILLRNNNNIWILVNKMLNFNNNNNSYILNILYRNKTDYDSIDFMVMRLFRHGLAVLYKVDMCYQWPCYKSISTAIIPVLCRLKVLKVTAIRQPMRSVTDDCFDKYNELIYGFHQLQKWYESESTLSLAAKTKKLDFLYECFQTELTTIQKTNRNDYPFSLENMLTLQSMKNYITEIYKIFNYLQCEITIECHDKDIIPLEWEELFQNIPYRFNNCYELLNNAEFILNNLKNYLQIYIKEKDSIQIRKDHRNSNHNPYIAFSNIPELQSYLNVCSLHGSKGKGPTFVSIWSGNVSKTSSASYKKPQGLAWCRDSWDEVPPPHHEPLYVLDAGNGCVKEVRSFQETNVYFQDTAGAGALNLPRGLCTYRISDDGKPCYILVVSDSNNNCIRGCALGTSKAFKSGQSFVIFGGLIKAQDARKVSPPLNGPHGLAIFQNVIILCDSNNHVLRSIRFTPEKVCTFVSVKLFEMNVL